MIRDTAETADVRRRRLRFRSWHRGTRELDLLLGPFADAHVGSMTDEELDQYEAILMVPDPDMYNWIVQREPVPHADRSPVLQRILDFHNS